MVEQKNEKWINYMAVSTVVIAVCATLSTFKGGGYSTKSLLCQSKASDQWTYFQSKSIKSYIYEIQKDLLELQLNTLKTSQPKFDAAEYEKKINKYSEKISKYDDEKNSIQKEAKDFEIQRDEAKLHAQAFGMAVIFLQVSILISSIAALIKRKPVWYCSLVTGIIGILFFIDGFFLFF